jgi:signal peptidase I
MPETAAHPLKSYNVPFDSMEPAIMTGSDVIGDVSHYSKHKPARWDVVAFTLANNANRFVKRIIGLPGETIQLTSKGLKIDGAFVPVPPALKDRFSSFLKHEDHKFGAEPYKVPADSVFVIGDNAHVYVTDSRELGPVPVKNLEARIMAAVHVTPIT